MHKNNGHKAHDSGLDSITAQLGISEGARFSSKQELSNGLNANRFADVHRQDPKRTEQEAVAFRQFSDGTLVELVWAPKKPQLRFLVWKNGAGRDSR